MLRKHPLPTRNLNKSSKYFAKITLKYCAITEDLQQLLSLFRMMAWAAEQLKNKPRCKKIRDEMVRELTITVCYLLDKATKEHFCKDK